MLNDIEMKRWYKFQEKHKKAKDYYVECHFTGIGEYLKAVAKYRFRTIKEDITEYDCW